MASSGHSRVTLRCDSLTFPSKTDAKCSGFTVTSLRFTLRTATGVFRLYSESVLRLKLTVVNRLRIHIMIHHPMFGHFSYFVPGLP